MRKHRKYVHSKEIRYTESTCIFKCCQILDHDKFKTFSESKVKRNALTLKWTLLRQLGSSTWLPLWILVAFLRAIWVSCYIYSWNNIDLEIQREALLLLEKWYVHIQYMCRSVVHVQHNKGWSMYALFNQSLA